MMDSQIFNFDSSIDFQFRRVSDATAAPRWTGAIPGAKTPFTTTSAVYEPDCRAGLKGREGVFPSTVCIKIKGYFGNIHRDCILT